MLFYNTFILRGAMHLRSFSVHIFADNCTFGNLKKYKTHKKVEYKTFFAFSKHINMYIYYAYYIMTILANKKKILYKGDPIYRYI